MDTTDLTINPKEQFDSEMIFNRNTSPLGKKRDVAAMLKVSLRSVDNTSPVVAPLSNRHRIAAALTWRK